MSNDILTTINTRATPQRTKAKAGQVANNAGGFVFAVTPETRIRRFLILGTTGGTYYQNERELTQENANEVLAWAEHNTKALVDILLEVSEGGRAPKQNPTIFALAAAAGLGDDEGRAYALAALPRIARTGTHLFMFAKYIGQFRGWGRGLRNAVADWYESKPADKLAYQMVKYRNREGWTHRDLLRKTHAAPTPIGVTEGGEKLYDTDGIAHKALYAWATKGNVPNVGLQDTLPQVVNDFETAQSVSSVKEWVNIVNRGNLSWEMLPDAALTKPEVWVALIEKGIPMTALIRQLPRLTNLGVLKGETLKTVLAQLSNQDAITKARVHPINLLIAQRTYAYGRSFRGSSSWTPNTKIIDALDKAFYLSFGNVVPANKRTMNALDVSGSMGCSVFDSPLNAREVSAAMSLVTLATEPEVLTVGFTGGNYWRSSEQNVNNLTVLNISARQRLDDVIRTISGLPFGTTDCALPMLYAREKSLEIDTFVIWTDNETWAGGVHPFQALRDYRKASGIPAKLVVCGVTASNFSIADPSDAGMLDVVGFDSAVPNLISEFSAGRL